MNTAHIIDGVFLSLDGVNILKRDQFCFQKTALYALNDILLQQDCQDGTGNCKQVT